MLSYLLGLIQEFERTHGRVPILVTLNTRHMEYLLDDCPNLSAGNEPFPFGFRINVLPEGELAHPMVSVLPVLRPALERAPWGKNDPVSRSPQDDESAASFLIRQAAHR